MRGAFRHGLVSAKTLVWYGQNEETRHFVRSIAIGSRRTFNPLVLGSSPSSLTGKRGFWEDDNVVYPFCTHKSGLGCGLARRVATQLPR